MNVILIVKIAKSALLGYVLRRALKETDTFICNKESKEKQEFLCECCCNLVPVKLFRVTIYNPYCPFCDSKIDHKVFDELYAVEDTQNEYKNNSNFSNEFEGLEYLRNSGN